MSVRGSLPAWIQDGEKYGLLALAVKIESPLPYVQLGPALWAFGDASFPMPAHWREWLGTIRAHEVQGSNLFVLSKGASLAPGILDGENQALDRRVWHFYVGLLLASRFAPAHKPVLLSGACHDGAIEVLQHKDLECPVPCMFRGYPALPRIEIERAVALGVNIESIRQAGLPGGQWRLFRTLALYTLARTIDDPLERTHQYCRCIDGLILPETGKTTRQFKSRTALFMGPKHHDFMGELYEIRSDVEHLHESRYLENFDRGVRLELIRKEAVAEAVAREALARIIGTPDLWRHFANTVSLAAFWALSDVDKRTIWGPPADPFEALGGFDPRFIPDGHLESRTS